MGCEGVVNVRGRKVQKERIILLCFHPGDCLLGEVRGYVLIAIKGVSRLSAAEPKPTQQWCLFFSGND